jgi:predicted AlkP superfamily phosphohydrolase/phosphomutase
MDGEEKYIANLTDIETRRAEQVFKFLAEEEWDLFFVVFTITDRAQHYFWKYMDPDHPYYDPEKARRYADAILKVYQQMDDFLGRLRATLDDQTTLMIMSDHGFGPIYQMINGQNFIDRTLPPGEIWAMTTDNYGARYHLAAATAPPYDQRIQQAYANAKDVLRKRLDELEDPDAGQRVIQKIFERDDLYWGPYAKEAPDILGLEYKGYKFLNGFPTPEGEIFIPKGYPAYDHLFSATHELNGVLIMAGNSVSQGVNNFDAHIMDIAPTVLYLLSEPIPEDMDGRALTAPLSGEYVRHHPLQTSHPSSGREHRLRDLADSTKAIDRLVEEQLKAIGYVH